MFEAAKWPHVTGHEAFDLKKGITNPDYSYAGLGGYEAMKAVLTAKFSDPALKQGLLLTGDAYCWSTMWRADKTREAGATCTMGPGLIC